MPIDRFLNKLDRLVCNALLSVHGQLYEQSEVLGLLRDLRDDLGIHIKFGDQRQDHPAPIGKNDELRVYAHRRMGPNSWDRDGILVYHRRTIETGEVPHYDLRRIAETLVLRPGSWVGYVVELGCKAKTQETMKEAFAALDDMTKESGSFAPVSL